MRQQDEQSQEREKEREREIMRRQKLSKISKKFCPMKEYEIPQFAFLFLIIFVSLSHDKNNRTKNFWSKFLKFTIANIFGKIFQMNI